MGGGGGGGAWTVSGVKREIGKKRGRVFLKGWYPNAHYKLSLR